MNHTPSDSDDRFPRELLYVVARMYYVEDATQADIAGRLRVSRPTISRMLAEARKVGIVRIEVVDDRQPQLDALASRLQDALGLRRIWLAPGDQSANIRTGLAGSVAEALAAMELEPGDAVLIASGNTLYDVARGPLPDLSGIVLVPTVGGVAEPEPWHQTNEITRSVAERTNARPDFLFAEAMPSAALFERLLDDPSFQRIRRQWAGAKGALLGIGAPPLSRRSISRSIPLDDDQMQRAVGDVALNFFSADGAPVEFEGSDRMVRPSREVLRAIPHTVGIAVGPGKAVSIRAAVRAGVVTSLITDERTATELDGLTRRTPA